MKLEDYDKYYQKGGTYNLPIEILNELFDEIENWKEENQQLKEQQKEFIKCLEDEIKERNIQMIGYHPSTRILIEQIIETEKLILSKYKEILKGDEKNDGRN